MNKKNKVLASLLVSVQLLGALAPTTVLADGNSFKSLDVPIGIERESVTDKDVELANDYYLDNVYSQDLDKWLDELLDRAKNMESRVDLDNLIEDYTKYYEHIDNQNISHYWADRKLASSGKAFDIHEYIREGIYDLGESAGSKRLINYSNKLVMAYTEGVTGFEDQVNDLYTTHFFQSADNEMFRIHNIMHVYIGKEDEDGPGLKLELRAGRLVSPLHEKMGIDLGKAPTVEDNKMHWPEDTGDIDTGIKVGESNNIRNVDSEVKLNDIDGTYHEFDETNGQRIRVDYKVVFVNGKETREESRTVEATGLTSMWSDKYSSMFGRGVGGSTQQVTNKKKKEVKTRLTLQYTLNKSDNYPVYIDTGLFADEDENVSYESLYEVLYQIAVNFEGGYLVEDSNKLLIVVEGKPVYIVESEDEYSGDEVAAIFEEFKDVGLVTSETRIGTTNSLEWQLRTGKEQNVIIDGFKLDLKNEVSIREDRVVLPLVEIMDGIGAEVNESGNFITVNYGEFVASFQVGVSEARVNGELVDLTAPVEKDGRGTVTVNLSPIFELFGIKSVWDEQESTLFLDNTLRPDNSKDEDTIDDEDQEENNE